MEKIKAYKIEFNKEDYNYAIAHDNDCFFCKIIDRDETEFLNMISTINKADEISLYLKHNNILFFGWKKKQDSYTETCNWHLPVERADELSVLELGVSVCI